jgi:hypothetical protein
MGKDKRFLEGNLRRFQDTEWRWKMLPPFHI